MQNKLKAAFSTYIYKVRTVIGGKKHQSEKRKDKDNISIAYTNPRFWLIDRIKELEEFPEFINLVSAINKELGGKPIDYAISNLTYMMRNFFRRSGCYLTALEGDPLDVDDYFDQLCDSYNDKEVSIVSLHFLGSVSFPLDLGEVDFGKFLIKRVTKEELDDLCQNHINRLFYSDKGIWDTKTLSQFWFIQEKEPQKLKKDKVNPDALFHNVCIIKDVEKAWEMCFKINRGFSDQILQQLILFDWNWDECSARSEVLNIEERSWMGFDIPIKVEIHNDLLEPPGFAPPTKELRRHWITDIHPITEEEIEKPPIYLDRNQLEELKELVKQAQRFSDIKPDQWKFIDTSMGYLAKAFFTEGLEQLLWHITTLEALFGEKSKGIGETVKIRVSNILEKDKNKRKEIRKKFDDLYDLRSELVHGKTESKQVYVGHLWQARDLARRSVVWFLNYLLALHAKLDSAGIPIEDFPRREEILVSLDLEEQEKKRLKILLENLPDDSKEGNNLLN